MDEKKLTDEQIIKALENCLNGDYKTKCNICPYDNCIDLCRDMDRDTLDLINRQKAEIERLTEEIDQRREMMRCMDCNYATELIKNAELQKQVDELKEENEELCKENTTLIAGSILQKEQVEKDTAKECYEKMLEDYPIICDEEHFYLEFTKSYRRWLKERFGVEVE